jgi:hypothetical protein
MISTKMTNLSTWRSRRGQSEGTEEWLTVACARNSVPSAGLCSLSLNRHASYDEDFQSIDRGLRRWRGWSEAFLPLSALSASSAVKNALVGVLARLRRAWFSAPQLRFR